ncbi:hypothetical protein DLE04_04155 [Actinobacteria bacterium IMCC26103]|nr:hypothetical protein DLE04_04155 [Actinobacteria bacterium IMCC26103]
MKKSSFIASIATAALSLSAVLVGVTSANASITLPKGAFLPCAAGGGTYCIESVSVTPSGGKAIALTWVATGSQGAAAGNTNGVAAGKELPGRWSADGAFANENYDGLYVEAQAANEFVPWIMLDAKPTYSPGNKVSLAATTTSATTPVNLNADALISVKMRISDFKLGVTYGIATEATVDVQAGVFEIAGYPVKVPQAKSTKDCSGDAGVSSALVTQFQSILVPSNDPLGFSFEGGSGKIYVGSNGLCKLSTPVWNSEKKSLSYKASAPRLAPDGKTVNTGFYYATISAADALALWGLKRAEDAASALMVSVRTTDGGSTAATKTVAVKNGRIIIQVFGFEFPDPMLDISLNPSFDLMASSALSDSNMSAQATVKKSPTPKPTVAPKTTTISCLKGNVLKKVTGVKPTCPTGYKKK